VALGPTSRDPRLTYCPGSKTAFAQQDTESNRQMFAGDPEFVICRGALVDGVPFMPAQTPRGPACCWAAQAAHTLQ
jgi:hypothetical protein